MVMYCWMVATWAWQVAAMTSWNERSLSLPQLVVLGTKQTPLPGVRHKEHVRATPRRTPLTFAPPSLAPVRLAPVRLARVRLAPVRPELERLSPVRSQLLRSQFLRSI